MAIWLSDWLFLVSWYIEELWRIAKGGQQVANEPAFRYLAGKLTKSVFKLPLIGLNSVPFRTTLRGENSHLTRQAPVFGSCLIQK